MKTAPLLERYTVDRLRDVAAPAFRLLAQADSFDEARSMLTSYVSQRQFDVGCLADGRSGEPPNYVVRDCARALRGMLTVRSEQRAGFSVAEALWNIARREPRPDLQAGFLADMTEILGGLLGRGLGGWGSSNAEPGLTGRVAALWRSDALDSLWALAEAQMQRIPDGLSPEAVEARARRRERVVAALGCDDAEFDDWQWQIAHVARDANALERFAPIGPAERRAITEASHGQLPFGVTPYYASLLDETLDAGRDRALRAQVIPTLAYVGTMREGRGDTSARDFMREHDTSPVDLVTRRYPAIAILKPFNTCPQICVYCQRNWEIDQAMAEGALAKAEKIDEAIAFIASHPAIREVLVTGGDPLGLRDEELLPILHKLASIPHVELLRLGTRTPVTLPMRITPDLARALGNLRAPGRREICVVTHVEHAYEVTPEFVTAVDRLKREGISVYNQLVYTFFVSRRFEAAKLRLLLRRCGVDPYYTFLPKGKDETRDYRVPIARLLQEQKEEARLLPGTRRTDEAVYNVPGLGKNYLRAFQHRDLIAVLPSGERVYEFHPWEKGVGPFTSYVGTDVPILDYLQRLEDIGEDPDEYQSIWTYF